MRHDAPNAMASTEGPSSRAKPLAGHCSQVNCALLGIARTELGEEEALMTKSERRGVHYRDLAAKCRDKGDKTPESQARAVLFEVAATWERMAAL